MWKNQEREKLYPNAMNWEKCNNLPLITEKSPRRVSAKGLKSIQASWNMLKVVLQMREEMDDFHVRFDEVAIDDIDNVIDNFVSRCMPKSCQIIWKELNSTKGRFSGRVSASDVEIAASIGCTSDT